jgi:hypothetical protein
MSAACKQVKRHGKFPSFQAGQYDSSGNETGHWQYFDTATRTLVAEGDYNKGLRNGLWKYYLPVTDSFYWSPYINPSQSIRTNIPDFLKLDEEGDSLVVFEHKGVGRLDLIIANGFMNVAINLHEYSSIAYDDLRRSGLIVQDSATSFFEIDDGRQYIYTYVECRKDTSILKLLNIACITDKGNLVEVTVKSDLKSYTRAKRLFFSVFPSLFIDSQKFTDTRRSFNSIQQLIR